MTRFAHVTGWGMAVPERVLSNNELSLMVDTSDDWIITRTGIRERHIAGNHESTSTLATQAALQALSRTELRPRDLQLIIVATASPDHLFPATACLVQDNLGATNAGAFDISAACTGFVIALNMAAQAIRTGSIDNALVIGAETLSRLVDWEDRGTCVLFGDGAGAFLLQASERPGGVLSCVMRSDGSGGKLLSVPAGGSRMPASMETVQQRLHKIHMNGREVFRFATRAMASAAREAAKEAGLEVADLDLVIPHQANLRIIQSVTRSLRLPDDRVILNIDRFGNTSSASIPIAACEALEEGRIRPEDKILLVAFGAGLTWGALTLHWVEPKKPVPPRRRRWLVLVGWLARLSSAVRRILRRIEGLIWRTRSRGKKK